MIYCEKIEIRCEMNDQDLLKMNNNIYCMWMIRLTTILYMDDKIDDIHCSWKLL
jgi:hypothetical protein